MPDVVSNTTPLISFLKLEKLEILQKLYGRIIIPREVYNEIEAGKSKDYYIDLSKMEWIHIQSIKDVKSLSRFLELDRGEAETIILANEIGAKLVLMDERPGRFHAEQAGLKISGTLGVLLRAKEKGIIPSISPLLFELKEKGIWLDNLLIERVLKLSGEE